MSSVRQQVLTHITNNPGRSFTNREIAVDLNIPQPSVRRATLALEATGQIGGKMNPSGPQTLHWQARQIEEAPVAESATV